MDIPSRDRQLITYLFEARGYIDDASMRIATDSYTTADHEKIADLFNELSRMMRDRGHRRTMLDAEAREYDIALLTNQ